MTRASALTLMAGALGLPVAEAGDDKSDHSRDATFFANLVDDVCIGVDTKRLDDERRNAIASLRRSTQREAFLALARLAASLSDVHINVFPSNYASYVRRGGGVFPITAIVRDGRLYAQDDRRSGGGRVPRYSEILRIGRHDAGELVEVVLARTGGQNVRLRETFASLRFALFALDGPQDETRVRWRTPGGTLDEGAVRFESRLRLDENARAMGVLTADYEFEQRGRAAIVRYNSCRDAVAFREFLARFETSLHSAERIIVDLRANSGGDSTVSDELLRRIAKSEYRQMGGSLTRVSERVRRSLGLPAYREKYGDEAAGARDGEIISRPEPTVVPLEKRHRFHAPTSFLIGPGTASSGLACANAAKEFGMGRLVGEETAEPVVGTGEVYSENLPATSFPAIVTTKLYFGVGPSSSGRGVVPDDVVDITVQDLADSRDPVLEAALS